MLHEIIDSDGEEDQEEEPQDQNVASADQSEQNDHPKDQKKDDFEDLIGRFDDRIDGGNNQKDEEEKE